MYQTKDAGYSEAIATIMDNRVILNWNQKDLGELVDKLYETSMMFGCYKKPLIKRFFAWFERQNAIEYERALPIECKSGSLAETMKGLE